MSSTSLDSDTSYRRPIIKKGKKGDQSAFKFDPDDLSNDLIHVSDRKDVVRHSCLLLEGRKVFGAWPGTELSETRPLRLQIFFDPNSHWTKRIVVEIRSLINPIDGNQSSSDTHSVQTEILYAEDFQFLAVPLNCTDKKLIATVRNHDVDYYLENLKRLYVFQFKGGKKLLTALQLAAEKNIVNKSVLAKFTEALSKSSITFISSSAIDPGQKFRAYLNEMRVQADSVDKIITKTGKLTLEKRRLNDPVFDGPEIGAKLQFRDANEYFTLHRYGVESEARLEKKHLYDCFVWQKVRCYLFSWPNGENLTFGCAVILPTQVARALKEKEQIYVNLGEQRMVKETSFQAEVFYLSDWIPSSWVFLSFISPKFDPDTNMIFGIGHTPPRLPEDIQSAEDFLSFLQSVPVESIEIRRIYSGENSEMLLDSIRKASERQKLGHLLSGHIKKTETTPMFQNASPAHLGLISKECENDVKKRDFFNWTQSLYMGIGLIEGPPGCGKKHHLKLLLRWLFLGENHPKVFIATSSNEQTIALANEIEESLENHQNSPSIGPVVRLVVHNSPTKEKQVLCGIPDDRMETFNMTEEKPPVSVVKEIQQKLLQQKTRPYVPIDRQNLTLGRKYANSETKFPDRNVQTYEEFGHKHAQAGQDSMSKGNLKSKRKAPTDKTFDEIKPAHIDTINIIIGNSKVPKDVVSISEIWKPTIVIVYDATKAAEGDTLCSIGNWDFEHLLLIGDRKDLQPLYLSANRFARILEISMFERFVRLGIKPYFLAVDYQHTEEICDFIWKLYYNDEVNAHSSTKFECRPLSKIAAKYNKEAFGIESHIMVSFIGGTEHKVGDDDWVNTTNVKGVLSLMYRMVKEFGASPEDLGVITPFCSQVVEYIKARTVLARKYPDEALFKEPYVTTAPYSGNKIVKNPGFTVSKIDQAQYRVIPHLFVDFVRTTDPEPMQNGRIVIDAMTRAKDSLTIVSDNLSMLSLAQLRALGSRKPCKIRHTYNLNRSV